MAGNVFGSGIPLATGFDLDAERPLDHRTVKATIAERDQMDTELYMGLQVYVEETKTTYVCVSINPVTWQVVGGNVKTGEGLGNTVDKLNVTTVFHDTIKTETNPSKSQIVTDENEVVTSVIIDKFGHVASVNKRTLYAELTWDRLVALFNANGFTLSDGYLKASEMYASNLVTWNSGNPTIVEGEEDPTTGRDPNALVQVTWSQIVALFNSHGFNLTNGTIEATNNGTLEGDNLITYTE